MERTKHLSILDITSSRKPGSVGDMDGPVPNYLHDGCQWLQENHTCWFLAAVLSQWHTYSKLGVWVSLCEETVQQSRNKSSGPPPPQDHIQTLRSHKPPKPPGENQTHLLHSHGPAYTHEKPNLTWHDFEQFVSIHLYQSLICQSRKKHASRKASFVLTVEPAMRNTWIPQHWCQDGPIKSCSNF